jgi:hypothetical protein
MFRWYTLGNFWRNKVIENDRPKIYERNPDTGVIRWRYVGESPDDYGWPHYGNILTEEELNDSK